MQGWVDHCINVILSWDRTGLAKRLLFACSISLTQKSPIARRIRKLINHPLRLTYNCKLHNRLVGLIASLTGVPLVSDTYVVL
jgi:hypothetical protein